MNNTIFGIFLALFFIHQTSKCSIAPKIGMKSLTVKRNNQSKPYSVLDSKKKSQNLIPTISCCFFCYCNYEDTRDNDQGRPLKFTTTATKLTQSPISKKTTAFKFTTISTKFKNSRPYGKFAHPRVKNANRNNKSFSTQSSSTHTSAFIKHTTPKQTIEKEHLNQIKNEIGETQMPSKSFIFFVIVIIILTMFFFIFLSLLAFKEKNTKLKKQPRRLSIVTADDEEHDETSKRKKSVLNSKNEKKTNASILERKRRNSI
jgi:hypothetical protein